MSEFKLTNRHADDSAKRLMNYLSKIEGKKIISGQHCNKSTCPDIEYIARITGKLPKLLGIDLLSYSSGIHTDDPSWQCVDEIANNRGSIKAALEWSKRGGIVTACWHWFSPTIGHDKSFYQHNTPFKLDDAFESGNDGINGLIKDMDMVAEKLKILNDNCVPVLWRPLHEGDGNWFWWGTGTSEHYIKLYRMMYERFTEIHHLNNLIWVWNAPKPERYPGDDVCDIASIDTYSDKFNTAILQDQYNSVKAIPAKDMPLAISEIGSPPDVDTIFEKNVNWLWFMVWNNFPADPQYNTIETLQAVYNNNKVITL